LNHSRAAGLNGTHIETLILGYPSNPSNLIDDPANRTEIKSCREFHSINPSRLMPGISRRAGQFKINFEQHQYLCHIDGFYLFCVQDEDQGSIIKKKKVRALEIEERFSFLTRALTKHHYFSLNWKKALK
jgi:hypothetical protein